VYNTSIPKINKQQAKPVSRPSVTPQVVETQGNCDPFGLPVIILTGTSSIRNCSEIEYFKKFKHKKNDTRKTKTTSLTNLTKKRVTITVQQKPRERKRKTEHHYNYGDQYRYNFKYFI
jgi:hypothetical protein